MVIKWPHSNEELKIHISNEAFVKYSQKRKQSQIDTVANPAHGHKTFPLSAPGLGNHAWDVHKSHGPDRKGKSGREILSRLCIHQFKKTHLKQEDHGI
ncbi:hypothetical protein VP01_2416g2 [Puccinia sorghi]|uniref:Uncharacterized protein n=1 Tax=Puccinia sorghi TaxID=27349 RepID=A0A0L6V6H8_9BASI|nr:hypothetical protein VP01_2416g2 [Puccinia sorghi]